MGFQSIHIFAAKRMCSVIRTGEVSCGKFPMVVDSCQPLCLKGISRPWRRANPLSSPRWVCATEEMVVLVYAMICMYMESNLKPKESSTATSTATLPRTSWTAWSPLSTLQYVCSLALKMECSPRVQKGEPS